MALLDLDSVSKRYSQGSRERVALTAVSLQVDAGELVGVVGRRRSGRTTLLQVAAGIEPPTEGAVSFAGVPLARRPMLGAPEGIGYVMTSFLESIAGTVLEHVAAPVMGLGAAPGEARLRAYELLLRVGAADAASAPAPELDPAEAVRVAIARALATRPRLLLADDPVLGVRLAERDALLELLASLAHDDGVGVLATLDSGGELYGCDRAVTLDMGELRGETLPRRAPVIPLARRRSDTGR